ncbi:hypothetical protein A1O1_04260 [Capronia coronata CBS 617.96]|uniref:Uncharacterized protein n=1 Tax=Capronia coronata CBS 617.96 TaxID=1182541 RepID=W9YPH9_9EURO|nr:uncharacterized protein A1O1_04260 [Capronia coronata CBS 617.96]EXJ91151.1 hypothetical protein A1O1_04260 [Capronia coronata CBS 617.96]
MSIVQVLPIPACFSLIGYTILTQGDGKKALQKPLLSPDGKYLAVIAADEQIHIINLAEAVHRHAISKTIKLPKSIRTFLKECNILRWSPETVYELVEDAEGLSNTTSTLTPTSDHEPETTWILISNGGRLVALRTDLPKSKSNSRSLSKPRSNILADYELGNQYGKATLVEYVFNHRHALVLFEFGTTAAILSLTKPERDEIAHVKFADARSFAAAPDMRYFALLRRDRGQDRVTVFEMDDGDDNSTADTTNKHKITYKTKDKITYKSFDVDTSDAQSVTWCPDGSPVLAICDSPAYGTRVCFFTAQGHALKQLNISTGTFTSIHINSPTPPPPKDGLEPLKVEGVGVMFWKWTKSCIVGRTKRTIQTVADGQKRVVIRSLDTTTGMATQMLAQFTHPDLIDGSSAFVWQEVLGTAASAMAPPTFKRHMGTFEVTDSHSNSHFQTHSTAQTQSREVHARRENDKDKEKEKEKEKEHHVDTIAVNSDQTMAATRLRSAPRTLFLWRLDSRQAQQAHPHTVLIFSNAVRQTLWHPWLPNVLLIVTTSRSPRVYVWFTETVAPVSGLVPLDTTPTATPTPSRSSTNFTAAWLPQCSTSIDIDTHRHDSRDADDNTNDTSNSFHHSNDNNHNHNKQCPILISSSTAFEAGALLSTTDNQLFFESILNRPDGPDTSPTVSSPSRSDVFQAFGKRDDTETTDVMMIDTPSRLPHIRPR